MRFTTSAQAGGSSMHLLCVPFTLPTAQGTQPGSRETLGGQAWEGLCAHRWSWGPHTVCPPGPRTQQMGPADTKGLCPHALGLFWDDAGIPHSWQHFSCPMVHGQAWEIPASWPQMREEPDPSLETPRNKIKRLP